MRYLLALTIFFALLAPAGAQTLDAPGSKVMVGPSSAMGPPVSASQTSVRVQVPAYYRNQGFYANGNYYNTSYYYGYGQNYNYGYYNNQGYGTTPMAPAPQQPRHFRDYHSQRRHR